MRGEGETRARGKPSRTLVRPSTGEAGEKKIEVISVAVDVRALPAHNAQATALGRHTRIRRGVASALTRRAW